MQLRQTPGRIHGRSHVWSDFTSCCRLILSLGNCDCCWTGKKAFICSWEYSLHKRLEDADSVTLPQVFWHFQIYIPLCCICTASFFICKFIWLHGLVSYYFRSQFLLKHVSLPLTILLLNAWTVNRAQESRSSSWSRSHTPLHFVKLHSEIIHLVCSS